ncbi:MAG: hypothetical protein ABJC09_05050 [Terriglobia bacterium]
MPTPAPAPTAPASTSAIGLDAVSAEINFIAHFIGDLRGKKASDPDKQRITALLAQAQQDLSIAADVALTILGQNPGIGEDD